GRDVLPLDAQGARPGRRPRAFHPDGGRTGTVRSASRGSGIPSRRYAQGIRSRPTRRRADSRFLDRFRRQIPPAGQERFPENERGLGRMARLDPLRPGFGPARPGIAQPRFEIPPRRHGRCLGSGSFRRRLVRGNGHLSSPCLPGGIRIRGPVHQSQGPHRGRILRLGSRGFRPLHFFPVPLARHDPALPRLLEKPRPQPMAKAGFTTLGFRPGFPSSGWTGPGKECPMSFLEKEEPDAKSSLWDWVIGIGLIALVGGFTVFYQYQKRSSTTRFGEADSLFQAGNLKEAGKLYEELK